LTSSLTNGILFQSFFEPKPRSEIYSTFELKWNGQGKMRNYM
jgi:hypothetical protein